MSVYVNVSLTFYSGMKTAIVTQNLCPDFLRYHRNTYLMYPSKNINSWHLVYEESLILKQILQKYRVQV